MRQAWHRTDRRRSHDCGGSWRRTACREADMAALPPTASDRSAGSTTAQTESFRMWTVEASCQTWLQRAHPVLVPRQGELAMVAEVALAPVRSERCFDMAVTALTELAHLARHFPVFERTTQAATQGALEQAPRAPRLRVHRRHTPRRSTRVRQVGIGPATQRA